MPHTDPGRQSPRRKKRGGIVLKRPAVPKPAFRKESKITLSGTFSRLYRSFREAGLSPLDAWFNAVYMRASDKGVRRAEDQFRREGVEPTESQKNEIHPISLRFLAAVPRFFRRFGGHLAGLFRRLFRHDPGNRAYRGSFLFLKAHIPHVVLSFFALFVLIYGIYFLSVPVVLEVRIDGQPIGAVESNAVVDSALRELEDNVSGILGRSFQFPFEIRYTFVRSASAEIAEKNRVSEILYSYLPDYICTASGLYVDGKLVAVCENAEDIRAELASLVAERVGNEGDVGVFNETLVVTQAYPTGSVIDRAKLCALLEEMTVPLAERGETETENAETITPDTADQSLPLQTGALLCDMELATVRRSAVTSNQPQGIGGIHLTFYRAETLRYQETVPFVTEYTESSELYTSMADVTTFGENGKVNMEARVYYVDGKEARRDILSENVVKAPVNQVVTMGTRVLPEELGITGITNRFIKPRVVPVASGYGEREDGMHRGWDLLGPEGANIYAAASGTVVTAIGPDGGFTYTEGALYTGYGYCVEILHEDGYTTLYGHCSAINVTLGQFVQQGEKIAEIGMTGMASGNHVHFEIKKDAERLNPADGYMYEGTTTIYDLKRSGTKDSAAADNKNTL